MQTETYPTPDQLTIRSLKARARGPFGSPAEIRALREEVDQFWTRTGSPAAEALRADLWHAERAMAGEPPKAPADCILRGTGMLGDGTPTEETFTCSKAEFAAEHGFDGDDPVVLAVLALEPGESTVLDMGAGGAWKIRCLTMDEAAAELDREATERVEAVAFTEENTDGYDAEDLATLNYRFVQAGGGDLEPGSDPYKALCERVLDGYEVIREEIALDAEACS